MSSGPAPATQPPTDDGRPTPSRRTSWILFVLFSAPFGMFYGGVLTASRGSVWLSLDRFGLGFVVLAGTLLALPLFGEGGGALGRWDEALLRVQERILGKARRAAGSGLRFALRVLLVVTLLVVDAVISHSNGGRLSHGYALYAVGLAWALVVLILFCLAAAAIWLLGRDPRSEGPQVRSLFELTLGPERRDATVALALLLFLLGSVLQYLSLGHASASPARPAKAAISARGQVLSSHLAGPSRKS